MNMGYIDEKNKQMKRYGELRKQYDEVAELDEYHQVCSQMPFDFLSAKQSAEVLTLAKEMGEDSRMKFSRADEAISLFTKIINTKKDKDRLLDNASLVVNADELARELNRFVDSTPYLSESLKVSEGGSVVSIANQVIKLLPSYPDLMTKSFLKSYALSCIESFDKDGLERVANAGCLSKGIVSGIEVEDKALKEKLDYVKSLFETSAKKEPERSEETKSERSEATERSEESKTVVFSKVKVVGVTHSNEDGESRQKILEDMSKENNPDLKLLKIVFTKDSTSKPAVEVRWGEKLCGYLSQQMADNLDANYKDFDLVVMSSMIKGGENGLSFGLEIDFEARERNLYKENEAERG